jgi:hypothetical protein
VLSFNRTRKRRYPPRSFVHALLSTCGTPYDIQHRRGDLDGARACGGLAGDWAHRLAATQHACPSWPRGPRVVEPIHKNPDTLSGFMVNTRFVESTRAHGLS